MAAAGGQQILDHEGEAEIHPGRRLQRLQAEFAPLLEGGADGFLAVLGERDFDAAGGVGPQ